MLLPTRFKLGFCATVAFCLFYLNLSHTIGRLSHDLTWDDIVYALSAVERLDILLKEGLYEFLRSWANPYPHSPYSELLAVTSIFLFGINDFGFYLSNFLLLIAVYFFLHYTFRLSDPVTFFCIFLFVMVTPLAYAMIDNFRPDFALALATTCLTWFTLRGILFGRERDLMWGGVSLGLALLIKPTFFAHTLAVAAGLACLAIFLKIFQRYYRAADLTTLPTLKYLLAGIVISAPYYVLAGDEIFEYFFNNTRGSESYLWSFDPNLSLIEIMVSYVVQGYLRHGGAQVPAAALIGVLFSPVLFIYGKRREACLVALLLIVAACSFGVMVFGRHKSEFFFATFHMLTLLSAIYAVAQVSESVSGITKSLLSIAFTSVIIVTTALNYKYVVIDTRTENMRSVSENRSIAAQLTQILAQEGRASDLSKEPATVFVPFVGPVSRGAIQWEARKAGFFLSGRDNNHSSELADHLVSASEADFVIVPYSMNTQISSGFPSSSIQTELAIALLNDPRFHRLPPRSPGDHYAVLERQREESQRVFDIDAPGSRTGFAQEEGPYPQWALPRVAWMSSHTGRLCLFEKGTYAFEMEAKTPTGANVSVSTSNGVRLADLNFGVNQFEVLSFELAATVDDPCIAIEYDPSVPPTGPGNYLLFRKLKITKVEE